MAAVTATDPATSTLRLVPVGYAHPDAHLLIEAVQEEYVVRYGGRDSTPLDPLMFEPPHGSFFVGYSGRRRGRYRRLAHGGHHGVR